MKNFLTTLYFLLTCFGYGQTTHDFAPKQLLIKLKSSHYAPASVKLSQGLLGLAALDQLAQQYQVTQIRAVGQADQTQTFLVVFQGPYSVEQAVQDYRSTQLLDFAEPNYIGKGAGVRGTVSAVTPNDNFFSRQWGLFNNGTFTVSGMPFSSVADADSDMDLAWDIQTGDPNMIIAVPDTGIRMTHNDMAARMWNKSALEPIDGVDNDGNGLIDDFQGWDWVNTDNNPADDYGHGTNCAGIIGAIPNNSVGYAGVNWNSKIMALKVLGSDNSGTYAAMASSIYYAVDNGAKIISMSIGGSGASSTLLNALQYANTQGVTFVACMMNFNNDTTYYPAGYASTLPNVIAVGATNSNDERTNPFFWSNTSGSNYGNHISVVAPGNYIWGLDYASNSGYNSYWGGTSQATPLVAGLASLMKAQNPSLTPAQIKTIIQNTAQDQVGNPIEDTAGFDPYMGWGRVNAHAALQQVLALEDFAGVPVQMQIINPVREDKLALKTTPELTGDFRFTVYSHDGKLLKTFNAHLAAGANFLPFEFPVGHYILEARNDHYSKIFKVAHQ